VPASAPWRPPHLSETSISFSSFGYLEHVGPTKLFQHAKPPAPPPEKAFYRLD
jgi:hypothetical protein